LKENKKRKHSDPFSSSDNSSSGSEDPRRKETFEKRKRHKTKADRYEAKNKTKDIAEEEKIIKKKPKKVKRGDAAKASRRAGEDLIRSFTSKNIAQARLTVGSPKECARECKLIICRCVLAQVSSGMAEHRLLLARGVVSGLHLCDSQADSRLVPDLAFSEMRFLKQPTHRPPSSEKEVIISKSAQKSKRERERARNEISNYFAPNRQPLRNIGTNQGRRESSALASDAGRSIVGSHIVLRKSYSQIGSPQRPRHQRKVPCLGFGTGLSSPQKLTLPKPQHDQIFVPRQMAKTASVTSSKPTSYVSWTETAQSGREHGRGTVSQDIHQDGAQSRCKQDEITVSEAAHRDQTRSSSPAELQRMLIESGIFKGMKIQAKLYPEREPGAQQRTKSPELHDDNAQPPMLPVPTSVETPSVTADANRPRPITKHDEERQHLLEAGRAALDDSERLDHNPQTTDIHSPNGADGLYNDVASETSPKQQEAAEHNIIHHYDEQRDWHAADEPTQAIPARPVSVVHRRIPEPIAMMEEIWTRQVRGQALYEGGEEHLYIPEVQRHEIVYGGEEDRRDQGSWDHFAETQTMQRIDEEMAVDEEIYDDVYEQQLFELEQDAADAYYDDAVGGEGECIEQSGLEQGYWLDDRTVGMEGGERYLTWFREGGTYFGRGGQHEHSLQRPSLQDLVPEEEQLRGFWRPQRY
jgi:hypothetical protein